MIAVMGGLVFDRWFWPIIQPLLTREQAEAFAETSCGIVSSPLNALENLGRVPQDIVHSAFGRL